MPLSGNGREEDDKRDERRYGHWSTSSSHPSWSTDSRSHPYHRPAPYSSDWKEDLPDVDYDRWVKYLGQSQKQRKKKSKRGREDVYTPSSNSDHGSSHSSDLPLPVGTDHYGQPPPYEMTWGTDQHGTWDNGVTVDKAEKEKGKHHRGKKSKSKHHRSGSRLFTPAIDVIADDGRDDTITPINLHERGADFARLGKQMLTNKKGSRTYAVVDGQRINNIVDIEPGPNASLISFKIKSRNREEVRVVKVEKIEFMGQFLDTESPVKLPDNW